MDKKDTPPIWAASITIMCPIHFTVWNGPSVDEKLHQFSFIVWQGQFISAYSPSSDGNQFTRCLGCPNPDGLLQRRQLSVLCIALFCLSFAGTWRIYILSSSPSFSLDIILSVHVLHMNDNSAIFALCCQVYSSTVQWDLFEKLYGNICFGHSYKSNLTLDNKCRTFAGECS